MAPVQHVSRRTWLRGCLAVAGASLPLTGRLTANGGQVDSRSVLRIETVTGPIAPEALGLTLMHEHVLVDFIGASAVSPSRYDAGEAFTSILPHLEQARQLGCETLVECTPAWLGRDPHLLKRLSEASGVRILTNTGYYGAAGDKFVPAHAFTETDRQLAARWIAEWKHGIDGTGIRPAFMKIGVDEGPLSDIDAKIVRAAAETHLATGMPIASHTGDGVAAIAQLDLLDAAKVPLDAFIWVHAQGEKDEAFHADAARRGAWVEFDGIGPSSVERHVDLVARMKKQGLLERVLVSHDAGWYRVGEPGGGTFRPYDTLFSRFVPALKAGGFSTADVHQLLVENPRRALTPRRT